MHFFIVIVLSTFVALNADIEITAPRARGSIKAETLVYEHPTVIYNKTTTITARTLEAQFDSKAKDALKEAVMRENVRLVDENKTITCIHAHYLHATKKLTLTGKVVITYNDAKKKQSAFAQADIVVYDCESQEVTLSGEKNKPVTTVITT